MMISVPALDITTLCPWSCMVLAMLRCKWSPMPKPYDWYDALRRTLTIINPPYILYNKTFILLNCVIFPVDVQKVPHVCVKQMTIDTEQFCHEMAEKLCNLAAKKYWFCSDFNIEIIDLCLETNDVVAAAFMLLEADVQQPNKLVVQPFSFYLALRFVFKEFFFSIGRRYEAFARPAFSLRKENYSLLSVYVT